MIEMRYDYKHMLVGSVVTCVIHSDDYKDDIHHITFEKKGKKFTLDIEGFECETKLNPKR